MELFGDHAFLPGVLQEFIAGPTSILAKGNLRQRLSLDESETGYHIDFGSQKIDIEQKARDFDAANMGNLSEFMKTGADLGQRIIKQFELLAKRLAIVRKNLVLDLTDAELGAIYQRLFKPTEFFAENPPFEWIWQAVAKQPVPGDAKEELNLITKVVRSQGRIGEQREVSLLQVEFDVNTVPARRQPRFGSDSFGALMPKMAEFHQRLEDDIMKVIKGE